MKVTSILNKKGNEMPYQLIIKDDYGNVFFQSYDLIIAKIDKNKKVTLDKDSWDYCKSISNYRSIFLNEPKSITVEKLYTKIYTLENLN